MIVTQQEAADFFDDPLFTEPQQQMFVSAADAFVKRYCGRPFERGTYTEIIALNGNAAYTSEDITSIGDVYADQFQQWGSETLVDPANVTVDGNRIIFGAGYWPPNYYSGYYAGAGAGEKVVKVTYTGGFWPWDDPDPLHVPKIPDDLRFATLRIVMTNRERGVRQFYESEVFKHYSYDRRNYGGAVRQAGTADYDHLIVDILDSYRRY